MDRRNFLTKLLIAVPGIALFLPKVSFAVPRRGLTVAQIMSVAKHPVQYEATKNGFHSKGLIDLLEQDRILIRNLGDVVEDEKGKNYSVEQIMVPMVWSKEENNEGTENYKIDMVEGLLVNAMNSLDDIILDKIGTGRAVVSKQYRYESSEVYQLVGGDFVCRMYTCLSFVDAKELNA